MTEAASKVAPSPTGRVHYLDWLRLVALLGVFVFHSMRPFDESYWHVKNADQSAVISFVLGVMGSWGLAFFFLIAGAGTGLALRWRSSGQYVRERLTRLLIPLIVGYVLLGPVQFAIEDRNHGLYHGSFADDVRRFFTLPPSDPPLVIPDAYHLWFIVLLLEFSLLGLPIFGWLRRPAGRRSVDWLAARAVRTRMLPLLMIAPVALVYIAAQAAPGEDHGWSEFVFYFGFFLLGHLLMADARLMAAVRRDLWPALALGAGSLLLAGATGVAGFLDAWWDNPSYSWPYVWFFLLITANAWGWILATLNLGLRVAAFQRPAPRPVMDAAMPFFLVHQPVILAVAYPVVQWNLGIPAKLAVVFVASLLMSALLAWGLCRLPVVSLLFGVKRRRLAGSGPSTVGAPAVSGRFPPRVGHAPGRAPR